MSQKIKILLVDDNEDEIFFIKEGFEATGLYEVVAEALNGNEMFSLLRKGSFPRPQVVISDLNMPGKNGYDVLKEIKENQALSSIPVVILSTAPSVPFWERCKELGAYAYFTKPDTFLQYKEFAQQIYPQLLQGCFGSAA